MASTQPTTAPVDPQFEQALTTIVGLVILDANKHATSLPSDMSTTMPAGH
jgi:hypothetical protein